MQEKKKEETLSSTKSIASNYSLEKIPAKCICIGIYIYNFTGCRRAILMAFVKARWKRGIIIFRKSAGQFWKIISKRKKLRFSRFSAATGASIRLINLQRLDMHSKNVFVEVFFVKRFPFCLKRNLFVMRSRIVTIQLVESGNLLF